MRIVCISDTHTMGNQLTIPDGDVLVHAGDLTLKGTESEMRGELRWLSGLPHQHKLFIAGNHDWFFDKNAPRSFRGWDLGRKTAITTFLANYPSLTYLQDSGITIDGINFWGSPWQPWYWDWAFNFPRWDHAKAQTVWSNIPNTTNVLITHGPPNGVLDEVYAEDERKGCPDLMNRIQNLTQLRLHVFGHLHESYGRVDYQADDNGQQITFVNAASCNRSYKPVNAPIIVDI